LQVTAPPALALPKMYHEEARSDLHLFCACVRACMRACMCQLVTRSVDSSGRIQLSFIQVFESNVQNVHHYSINIIEVCF